MVEASHTVCAAFSPGVIIGESLLWPLVQLQEVTSQKEGQQQRCQGPKPGNIQGSLYFCQRSVILQVLCALHALTNFLRKAVVQVSFCLCDRFPNSMIKNILRLA